MLVITHLSIDWSTEGVATGGEVGARVLVLEHDLAVSVPEVPLAHNSPNISGVSISSLAKRRNLLPKATIIFSWVNFRGNKVPYNLIFFPTPFS